MLVTAGDDIFLLLVQLTYVGSADMWIWSQIGSLRQYDTTRLPMCVYEHAPGRSLIKRQVHLHPTREESKSHLWGALPLLCEDALILRTCVCPVQWSTWGMMIISSKLVFRTDMLAWMRSLWICLNLKGVTAVHLPEFHTQKILPVMASDVCRSKF